jgi:hypothetical protein
MVPGNMEVKPFPMQKSGGCKNTTGISLNKVVLNLSAQEIIRDFINTFLSTDKLYDDKHIDTIAGEKIIKNKWITAGLNYLDAADTITRDIKPYCQIYLSLSLIAKEHIIGINFHSLDELYDQLDVSPPSLYIFRRGITPSDGLTNAQYNEIAMDSIIDYKILYIEFKQSFDVEYRRSVWFRKI